MTKLVLIIIVIYTAYYAGNILYDLFLNNTSPINLQESDHISIHEFEKEQRSEPAIIGIEDVENLQTPKSFSKINFQLSIDENMEDRMDIDYWRDMFETEQSMEDFTELKLSGNPVTESDHYEEGIVKETSNVTTDMLASMKIQNRKQWHQLMNMAETTVQLISNENGYKVYHSSAF